MSLSEIAKARLEAPLDALDPDLADRVYPVLVEVAREAHEGRVSLGFDVWATFTVLEQRAWNEGARLVAAQDARRQALAQRGEAGYLAAGADTEGWIQHDRAVAAAFADALSREARS